MLKLVIGNRNYSSWSLRAWLYLTESGIEFDEHRVALFVPGWRERVAAFSPAGRVPVLIDGDITVWDSLAIMEYLRETRKGVVGWPPDQSARACARAVSAEMHAGFLALRGELPQNIRGDNPLDPAKLSDKCRSDIARIDEIWLTSRERFGKGGPWLFGEFSIADVMFAPVALRFRTYAIPLSAAARAYAGQIGSLASIQRWARAARDEPETLPFIDDLDAVNTGPLVLG